ncbi:hypothetical protein DFJ74DRAFT_753911 [Hyaloraphidium curvatum]|nr:hypothetical protein DFJ74DRAFT_753911 [Hyaloraphidium curvatum]
MSAASPTPIQLPEERIGDLEAEVARLKKQLARTLVMLEEARAAMKANNDRAAELVEKAKRWEDLAKEASRGPRASKSRTVKRLDTEIARLQGRLRVYGVLEKDTGRLVQQLNSENRQYRQMLGLPQIDEPIRQFPPEPGCLIVVVVLVVIVLDTGCCLRTGTLCHHQRPRADPGRHGGDGQRSDPEVSVYGSNPAQFLEELPEFFPDAHEQFVKEYFEQFCVR